MLIWLHVTCLVSVWTNWILNMVCVIFWLAFFDNNLHGMHNEKDIERKACSIEL